MACCAALNETFDMEDLLDDFCAFYIGGNYPTTTTKICFILVVKSSLTL